MDERATKQPFDYRTGVCTLTGLDNNVSRERPLARVGRISRTGAVGTAASGAYDAEKTNQSFRCRAVRTAPQRVAPA